MFDKSGNVTDYVGNATKYEFTVRLTAAIYGQTVADIMPMALTSNSIITVQLPNEV